MPIKLLQHKSWHVYSKDNIARVARDEEDDRVRKALEERDSHASRSRARLNYLRYPGAQSEVHSRRIGEENDALVPRVNETKSDSSVRKRKRMGEMEIVDAHIASRSSTTLESDYVTREETDTFGNLKRMTWYESGSIEKSDRPRKKADAKDLLDPLIQVKAALARKKAMKETRDSLEAPDPRKTRLLGESDRPSGRHRHGNRRGDR